MIITITLNPAVDKTVEVGNFTAGAVNRVSSMRLDAGGKGINVSKVIASLGGKSKALGILGGGAGRFIKEYLDGAGIDNEFLFVDGETRTNLKIVDSLRKTNTDINEPGPSITDKDSNRLTDMVLGNFHEGSVAVFSGSVPKGIDANIYGQWISKAKKAGARTILDADGELFKHGVEAGPYLIKPNIHELEGFFGKKIDSMEETEKLGRLFIDNYGVQIVVISLGSKGAIFLNKRCSLLAPGIDVDVKSTVGAGDSMVAALAHSIDRGYDFEKAARLAMAASAANVMTSGTQPAEYETIVHLEKQASLQIMDNCDEENHG